MSICVLAFVHVYVLFLSFSFILNLLIFIYFISFSLFLLCKYMLYLFYKEENEKAGLKLNIQKMKIMASAPITLWQIDDKTKEAVIDVIFLGSKITADGDCSHEIKRCFLLGRKAMTRLDSILKHRVITLLTKVHLGKAMVFPVVMYGCENWTIKQAESQRTDAFEVWCWKRLLKVPWTPRSNQSILKEINSEIH